MSERSELKRYGALFGAQRRTAHWPTSVGHEAAKQNDRITSQ
jgi:hypothetical protein